MLDHEVCATCGSIIGHGCPDSTPCHCDVTMLDFTYPKIPFGTPRGECIVFEKLDGSNLSWYWKRGFGFSNPSTRRRPLTRQEQLGEAIPLFKKISQNLDRVLARKTEAAEAKVFFEFYGPNSFAGEHTVAEEKKLVLLDVAIDKNIMSPFDFIQIFINEIEIPTILFNGKFTGGLTDAERFTKNEGIVIKGVDWMLKAKTKQWLQRLSDSKQLNWTAADGIERSVGEEYDSQK